MSEKNVSKKSPLNPIRLPMAKTSRKIVQKMKDKNKRIRQREINREVKDCARQEFIKIRKLIKDACENERFYAQYYPPEDMSDMATHKIAYTFSEKLRKYGYRTEIFGRYRYMLAIYWQ